MPRKDKVPALECFRLKGEAYMQTNFWLLSAEIKLWILSTEQACGRYPWILWRLEGSFFHLRDNKEAFLKQMESRWCVKLY